MSWHEVLIAGKSKQNLANLRVLLASNRELAARLPSLVPVYVKGGWLTEADARALLEEAGKR